MYSPAQQDREPRMAGRDSSVSAVIPAYNCARFLPLAVESIRRQTMPVREILVVDDGSTDETADVVRRLGADIRYCRQENAGPSAARNLGVANANGDVIAFLDADDEWLPNAVEKQTGVLKRYPDVALVTGDMTAVDETGASIAESWFARHGISSEVRTWRGEPVPNAVAEIVRCNFVGTSVAMVRRSVFQSLGGFRTDLRYGEDLELWARIAVKHGVVCLPDVLGLRRSHPHNTTKSLEPMLRDLVRMSEIVDAWGSDILRRQGLNPDDMVAAAMTSLGYWLFTNERHAEAREVLWNAARRRISSRIVRLLAASYLPRGVTRKLRRLGARTSA